MNDPIVEETRRIRDEFAKRFDYDPEKIFNYLQAQEKASSRKVQTVEESLKLAAENAAMRKNA